jgi:hypothetical protein
VGVKECVVALRISKLTCVLPFFPPRLYTDLLKDSLNEYSYDAEVAGLHYNIENQLEGMLVCILESMAKLHHS